MGRTQASESGKILSEIVTAIKKVSDLNQEIASASQEQSNGIQQISKAMNQMDQGTQQNAAASEEAAASAEELSAQSETLRAGVTELELAVLGDNTAQANATVSPKVKKKPEQPFKVAVTNVTPMRKTSKKVEDKSYAHNVIPFDDDQSLEGREKLAKASDF